MSSLVGAKRKIHRKMESDALYGWYKARLLYNEKMTHNKFIPLLGDNDDRGHWGRGVQVLQNRMQLSDAG